MAAANSALRDACRHPRAGRRRGDAAPLHPPRQLRPARGLHRRRARRRRPQGYARMEWHDLADGDRLLRRDAPRRAGRLGHRAPPRSLVRWLEERACASWPPRIPTDRRAWFGHYLFGGDTEVGGRARAPRATRRAAGTPRCSAPTSRTSATSRSPEGYKIRIPEVDELPAVFEMYVAAFAEHWGEYEESDQRIEEWVEDPDFRRELQVVVSQGDEPAVARSTTCSRRSRDGSVRGLLDARRARIPATGASASPGRRSTRASGCSATRARPRRTSAWTPSNHNRAMALYESCGFRVASSATNYRKPFRRDQRERRMTIDTATTAAPSVRARRSRARVPPRDPRRLGRHRRGRQPRRGAPTAWTRCTTGRVARRRVPRSRDVPARARHRWSPRSTGGRSPWAFGFLVVARRRARRRDTWGAVLPGHRRRRHRDRAVAGDPRPPHGRAAAADPRPGPARAPRRTRSTRRRRDRALLDAEGYVPIRFGFEMRRLTHRRAARAPAPRGHRAAAGRPRTSTGAIFEADNEAFRDHWGHREQEEADFQVRFDGPETDTVAVVRGLGRRPGRGLVENAIYRRGERDARDQRAAGWSTSRSAGVARPGRREGAVRGLVPGAARAGHGRGVAGRRRGEPDRGARAVRGPRVPRRAALAGVRPAARTPRRRPTGAPEPR